MCRRESPEQRAPLADRLTGSGHPIDGRGLDPEAVVGVCDAPLIGQGIGLLGRGGLFAAHGEEHLAAHGECVGARTCVDVLVEP